MLQHRLRCATRFVTMEVKQQLLLLVKYLLSNKLGDDVWKVLLLSALFDALNNC